MVCVWTSWLYYLVRRFFLSPFSLHEDLAQIFVVDFHDVSLPAQVHLLQFSVCITSTLIVARIRIKTKTLHDPSRHFFLSLLYCLCRPVVFFPTTVHTGKSVVSALYWLLIAALLPP